jgi:hypothetical protein
MEQQIENKFHLWQQFQSSELCKKQIEIFQFDSKRNKQLKQMLKPTWDKTFISQATDDDILINQLEKIGWPNLLTKKESSKASKFINYISSKIESPSDAVFTSLYLPSNDVMARLVRICILGDSELFLNML